MSLSAVFRRPGLLFLAFALAGLPVRLAADLVWTPEGGWRIEGGVFSGLSGQESHNALELMNRARSAEEKRHFHSALGNYEKVTKRFPNSVYAPEAFYRMAYVYLARHQYLKAFQSFQEIVMRYPNTTKFNQVIGEQYRIACELLDGARNRGWLILPGFRNRESSLGLFEQVLSNAPYSEYAPLSLMSEAKAFQTFGEYEESIDALDRMINTYPKSLLTPDAYLKMGQAYASLVEGPNYDQSATKEAITYFEDFVILYPGDPNIAAAEKGLGQMKTVLAESKLRIGEYYFKYRKNYKAARVFYNEAITDYPDSAIATRARTALVKVDALLAAQEKAAAGGTAPLPPPPRKKHFLFF